MHYILDRTNDAQRFPLSRLLESVRQQPYERWEVLAAHGYGPDVCDMERKVDQVGKVLLAPDALLGLSRDRGQWFFDLRCRRLSDGLRFGIIDSGRLFVDGGLEEELRIVRAFENVEHAGEKS